MSKNIAQTAVVVAQAQTQKKTFPALDSDQQTTLNQLQTVSSKIRYLHSLGWSKGDISRKLDKRFQHVRNVLLQPLKNK